MLLKVVLKLKSMALKILVKGDAYIAPKTTMPGAVALEEGSLLVDVFSPKRADFL